MKKLLWINIALAFFISLLGFLIIENIKLNISYGRSIMPLIYINIIVIAILIILDWIEIRKN